MPRVEDASFEIYLKEIRETPLLTADQEKELGRKVQAGDAAARDHMIRANLRLVVAISKEFLNRGLSFMDLIAEGNLGLLKAVERFEPEQGNRFSTYGTWWIKQSIRRALVNSSKTVRIPSYMVELISHFKQKSFELQKQRGGITPEVQEVADILGFTEDQLEMLRRAMNSGAQTTDFQGGPDGESSITDMIADQRSPNPAEEVTTRAEIEKLSDLLGAIDQREAEILRLRYGIGCDRPMTLSEIGEMIGLTRERVRQIENEALRRLHGIITHAKGYQADDE